MSSFPPVRCETFPLRQVGDVEVALNQKMRLLDTSIRPILVDLDDPRRDSIVAVLATSAPVDDAVVERARECGVWLH